MEQCVRALAAVAENVGSIPRTQIDIKTMYNVSANEYIALF